ncbi:glycyl-radical enzyme activating protein [Ruminococcaceae bacterium OttesenSCG-928-I18]|nr:glycyl-radical enzyme activating protein [Ruminococcaceae bacterium OttesenSCG-928-I18]
MTGLVFDIQRYSVNDGHGIRTNIFLQGCPLRCLWCANPESQPLGPVLMVTASKCIGCGGCAKVCSSGAQQKRPVGRALCTACRRCEKFCPTGALRFSSREMSAEEVLAEAEKDRPFYEESGGGITLSGGEPLAQWEFAAEVLAGAQQRGIHTAIETTGLAPFAHLQPVLAHTDLVLYDIKHMDSEKHRQFTGVPNERILENARRLPETGAEFILRVPLIVGVNCDEENLRQTAAFAAEIGAKELHLLPYHRMGEPKYEKIGLSYAFDGATPDGDALRRAGEIMEEKGIRVHIGG